MFGKNINTILSEVKSNNSELLIEIKNNIPMEIDEYYQKKMEEFSKKMIDKHKEFINKEKDLFTAVWNDLKYGKGSVNTQYKLLTTKYNIYAKNTIEQLDADMNQIAVYILSTNKDIKMQRNLIKKFITEKRTDIQYARFESEPIAFSTCLFPDVNTVISLGLESEDNKAWFMDENRLAERMINELKLYNDSAILTSEEIIELFDKYIIDLKQYFDNYKKYNNALKDELKQYIENKQNQYQKELNLADGNAKQVILNKLRVMMDRYFNILKMLTFHYNIQLRFIFGSFKSMSNVMQKAYNFTIKNHI